MDVGEARRHRPPAVALVRLRGRRREARRARGHRLPHDVGHRRELVVGGVALVAVVAHHEEPDRGVADVRGEVEDAAVALDGVEVLGEGLEVPRDPGLQRGQAHVLDVVQRARDELAVLGPARRDREPAVAGDDARDAMPRRRRERGVPVDLRVVVRVDVDEPRGHHVPVGLEDARAVEALADLGDATVGDGDVGPHARRTRAVDDGAAANDEICAHVTVPLGCLTRSCPRHAHDRSMLTAVWSEGQTRPLGPLTAGCAANSPVPVPSRSASAPESYFGVQRLGTFTKMKSIRSLSFVRGVLERGERVVDPPGRAVDAGRRDALGVAGGEVRVDPAPSRSAAGSGACPRGR